MLARIPAAARPETREGAEAFARFFFQQVNIAFTTSDADTLPGLYEADCAVCASLQSAAEDLATKRERHSDPSLEVTGASVRDYTPALRTVVVFVRQNSVPVTNIAGRIVRETNKEEGAFLATLVHQKGRWSVTKLQVAK